jgi:hypothetical protein
MNTLFLVLGCLDEYDGRWIADGDDRIEHFYGNERAVAEVFHGFLIELAAEHHLDGAIGVEVDPESGAVVFRSAALASLISSCYTAGSYISKQVFDGKDSDAKLSYLGGSYLRYGEGNLFRFANAKHKAELIKELLAEFGCTQIELIHANPGYIPFVHEVRFEMGSNTFWILKEGAEQQ